MQCLPERGESKVPQRSSSEYHDGAVQRFRKVWSFWRWDFFKKALPLGSSETVLAEYLQKDEHFFYKDPISNMIINVIKPGQCFNWHFDTNEFTITMLLEPAESGGFFEYVPELRRSDNECIDDVKKIINWDRRSVWWLELKAGDLQFFLGRFTLHQVTRNTCTTDMLLLVQSFAVKPGMYGSSYRVKDLYGWCQSEEEALEENKVRADGLLD